MDSRAGLDSVKIKFLAHAEIRISISGTSKRSNDFREKGRKRKERRERTNFGCPPQRVNSAMNETFIRH
jgi:hypothetical protein